MAKTSIADVIVPSEFEKYVIERTATQSAFGASGIVESDPFFDALAGGGGNTVDMPFWQDVNPTRQILSDATPLTVNKITASKDIARIQMDGNAWSVNDLAKVLSGAEPLRWTPAQPLHRLSSVPRRHPGRSAPQSPNRQEPAQRLLVVDGVTGSKICSRRFILEQLSASALHHFGRSCNLSAVVK